MLLKGATIRSKDEIFNGEYKTHWKWPKIISSHGFKVSRILTFSWAYPQGAWSLFKVRLVLLLGVRKSCFLNSDSEGDFKHSKFPHNVLETRDYISTQKNKHKDQGSNPYRSLFQRQPYMKWQKIFIVRLTLTQWRSRGSDLSAGMAMFCTWVMFRDSPVYNNTGDPSSSKVAEPDHTPLSSYQWSPLIAGSKYRHRNKSVDTACPHTMLPQMGACGLYW